MGVDEPVDFETLKEKEQEEIVRRRNTRTGESGSSDGKGGSLQKTGLSLSGGGVRSACFNLGLLEGLDRLAYEPPAPNTPPRSTRDASQDRSCLECFDYVSSVSGGSYAAGHFAMAMVPPPSSDCKDAAYLGKVDLSSKTVPGWLWGVGAWFLGVAFQILKTGALLVGALALVAFVLRMLDGPTSYRFWYVVGLRNDVTRGFVPFWISLGVFLTGYGLQTSNPLRHRRGLWFRYASALVTAYVAAVWFWYEKVPAEGRSALPFWVQYAFLFALVVPVLVFCSRVLALRMFRSLGAILLPKSTPAGLEESDRSKRLQNVLLLPLLVALFCFAGLVATGDIGLTSYGDTPDEFQHLLEKGERYGRLGDEVYRMAVWAVGLISAVFLFPRKLFQSARAIEEHVGDKQESSLRRWGLEPVFRVVIFLCSYGFVLLIVFVVYSTVVRENVSGYFEWRDSLPSAALHPSEFRSWERAWDQIAQDAKDAGSRWQPLATALMAARNKAAMPLEDEGAVGEREGPPPVKDDGEAGAKEDHLVAKMEPRPAFPLFQEKAETAEIRLLDTMPWIVRLFPPLMWFGPEGPWIRSGIYPSRAPSRLYDLLAHTDQLQIAVAEGIAQDVLSQPLLYKKLEWVQAPPDVDVDDQKEVSSEDPVGWKAALDVYRVNAQRLNAAIGNVENSPSVAAAVRNNNRKALRLYLPRLVRDRHGEKKQVFAWIVWREDQWARLWIAGTAIALWLLCCAVDSNTFGLQKFYRRHVVDGWVKASRTQPDGFCHWLNEVGRTYRGHEHGENGAARTERHERRAPVLLINATLEGNRSLGDEPSLKEDLFTFSPLGAGSGETAYWLYDDGRPASFLRRNNLDVGNMVATSGAFLSPGTVANPALSAILHLLNIQTGYWIHDPDKFDRRGFRESLMFHITQSLGIDCGGDSRYMLTDGAHVENLGLYALLQRRCSLIVASDCSQGDRTESAGRRFDSLMQVLQQAGVDGIEFGPFLNSHAYRHWLETKRIAPTGGRHGCDRREAIGLDLVRVVKRSKANDKARSAVSKAASPNGNGAHERAEPGVADAFASLLDDPLANQPSTHSRPFAQEHYVFSRILYPDGTEGMLVYLRPTLTGDEGDGLLHAAVGSTFPDDDPLDQFYTPAKMNTYRLLGRHIATELMHDPVMRSALHQCVVGDKAVKGWTKECNLDCDCCGNAPHVECEWRRQPRLRSMSTRRMQNPPEQSEV